MALARHGSKVMASFALYCDILQEHIFDGIHTEGLAIQCFSLNFAAGPIFTNASLSFYLEDGITLTISVSVAYIVIIISS